MTDTTSATKTYDVAVLGCGLLGSALARNFAAKGHRTAAWNRTQAKAEALAGGGVSALSDVDEAVRSSKLVVAVTSTYATTREALAAVADWTGTTLVNVGTGTPAEAEELKAWAEARGVHYLDGAVLCYPQQVGTKEGMVLYSGSAEAWAEHEQTLMAPGPYSMFVSDNVKAASVLDTAIIGGFYSAALSAYVEASTYALDQGVDPETLNAISELAFHALAATGKEGVGAIASDQHETETATLGVYAEGCRATLGAMQSAGHQARLLAAAVENLNEAEKAGLGSLGFFASTKVARTNA
ncbi:NAD(P)-dependent oxidoreductase [Amycolatopsis anabasis]|uniref:NAD(P)-dependent oxidoreductase n=1 Tax=Amycolatopsis anabasis TaxID=1840409 RepID=UPI00131E29DB|nr:NAD(P)-binding domain-containing protein [Amycolatopsis anabasis]